MSLATVLVKIVVSKAYDFFVIIYAVALSDYNPSINDPNKFILIATR